MSPEQESSLSEIFEPFLNGKTVISENNDNNCCTCLKGTPPNNDFVCPFCNILTIESNKCDECNQGVCDDCLSNHPLTGCRECGAYYCDSCLSQEDTYECNVCQWIYHNKCKPTKVCNTCDHYFCEFCDLGEENNFKCIGCIDENKRKD